MRAALSLAHLQLLPEDWAHVDQVFMAERDPMAGTIEQPEDFKAIFSRLASCAPPPLGLGSGAYGD